MTQDPGALVADLDEARLRSLLPRPKLLVLALDQGKGVKTALGQAKLRNPLVEVAGLSMKDHGNLADACFGDTAEAVLLLREGVVLEMLPAAGLTAEKLDEAIQASEGQEAAELRRRFLGDFAEKGPIDRTKFKQGVSGHYHSSEGDSSSLHLEAGGEAVQQEVQSGVQGSSTTTRSGRWSRLLDGRIELLWTRGSNERILLRWKDGVVVELSRDGDRVPGSGKLRFRYVRS